MRSTRFLKMGMAAILLAAVLLAGNPGLLQAQTQGQVALQLAGALGLSTASPDAAIAALKENCIVLSAGWNAAGPADTAFLSQLYAALEKAVTSCKLTLPAGLNNPSALAANAAANAGLSSDQAVKGVVSGGGSRSQAVIGTTLAAGAGLGMPGAVPGGGSSLGTVTGPAGGASGGGGGVGVTTILTPSR